LPPRVRLLFWMTAAVLAASLLLGGATRAGYLSDAALQIIAIPLLIAALWRSPELLAAHHTRLPFLFALAVIAVPLLQLVPLPPNVWTALPQRDLSTEAYSLAGASLGWMPLSVSPEATWLSAISMLPALAVFLGTLSLGWSERRRLTLVAIALGVLSAFVGLTQVSQGPFSALRFFETAHKSEAVGFFVNRNHFAALLYCLLLLVTAWLIHSVFEGSVIRGARGNSSAALMAVIAALACQVVLLGAIATARSRAGLALTIGGLLGAVALAMSDRRVTAGVTPVKLMIGTMVVTTMLIAQFALYRVIERFTSDPLGDERFVFARNTIDAAKAYWPFGSGIGTFVPVYGVFEKVQSVLHPDTYVNHAHNDLLELWLESGVVGLVLVGIVLIWLALRFYVLWWKPWPGAGQIDRSLARASSIAVALLLAHSLVDYPLRTTAMMSFAAFLCALMVQPLSQGAPATAEAAKVSADAPDLPTSPADLVPPRKPELWGTEADWPDAWRLPPKR
jgi:O-antigen ligase